MILLVRTSAAETARGAVTTQGNYGTIVAAHAATSLAIQLRDHTELLPTSITTQAVTVTRPGVSAGLGDTAGLGVFHNDVDIWGQQLTNISAALVPSQAASVTQAPASTQQPLVNPWQQWGAADMPLWEEWVQPLISQFTIPLSSTQSVAGALPGGLTDTNSEQAVNGPVLSQLGGEYY